MRRRQVTAALLGCALLGLTGCGDDDPSPRTVDAGPSGVSSSATASTPTSIASGLELNVNGQPVQLPPPPAGGFDPAVTVRIGNAPPLRAEVARRPDQRSRGLMQRREVPEGTGMVFLFASRNSAGFWMLGTLVPLSIAYVDGDRVVSTAEMLPCPTQSGCPSYAPEGPYTLAVEARAGFFPDHGVRPGDRVTIEGATQSPA